MLFGICLLAAVNFLALCALVAGAWEILDRLHALQQQVNDMSAEFDDLKAAVAEQTTLDRSVLALINGFADRLAGLDSPSKADLKALADELRAGASPLAAAVAQNTPAGGPQPQA